MNDFDWIRETSYDSKIFNNIHKMINHYHWKKYSQLLTVLEESVEFYKKRRDEMSRLGRTNEYHHYQFMVDNNIPYIEMLKVLSNYEH